jgi:hypothetical protein
MMLFGKERRKLTDDYRPGGTLDLLEAFFGERSSLKYTMVSGGSASR